MGTGRKQARLRRTALFCKARRDVLKNLDDASRHRLRQRLREGQEHPQGHTARHGEPGPRPRHLGRRTYERNLCSHYHCHLLSVSPARLFPLLVPLSLLCLLDAMALHTLRPVRRVCVVGGWGCIAGRPHLGCPDMPDSFSSHLPPPLPSLPSHSLGRRPSCCLATSRALEKGNGNSSGGATPLLR